MQGDGLWWWKQNDWSASNDHEIIMNRKEKFEVLWEGENKGGFGCVELVLGLFILE